MKRIFPLLALVPLLQGCVAAAVGGGILIGSQVLANNVQVAQVALDVEQVWPSVKETAGFYQDPGSEATVQDFPRTIQAKVDGSKVTIEVEAIDLDRTTIRVAAEKYGGVAKDNATAAEVMNGILKRLEKSH